MTSQQLKLLSFIRDFIAEHTFSPSYDDMRIGMGLNSKSGIHRLVHALRDCGKLTFRENRAHSIELVDDATPLAEIKAAIADYESGGIGAKTALGIIRSVLYPIKGLRS